MKCDLIFINIFILVNVSNFGRIVNCFRYICSSVCLSVSVLHFCVVAVSAFWQINVFINHTCITK